MCKELAIVVTAMPATNSQGLRYKAVCTHGAFVSSYNYALDGKANAQFADTALCAQLEHATGASWTTRGTPMDNPGKVGSYIVVAVKK